MNKERFLSHLLPGNYFITKSMELTRSQTAGTLWYIKKFLVLYDYIFIGDNIRTLDAAREVCRIFDNFILSLPDALQLTARRFFYSPTDVADLRSPHFRLFDDFAGLRQFANEAERQTYYECAKKYYMAFLMGSGGQSGINAIIKKELYKPHFVFSQLDDVISDYASRNGFGKYRTMHAYIQHVRNDYMAFVRNERQILFYYGFCHSKSSGSIDREFSSLTPLGELAQQSNFYELLAIWEHQKLKMVSQPVTIDIGGLSLSASCDATLFATNNHPYLTILRALRDSGGFTKEVYQYIISRLTAYPDDGIINTDDDFLGTVEQRVANFHRTADVATEDFNKELMKYLLGVRSDLRADAATNPLGLCRWSAAGVSITNRDRLNRLVGVYSVLSRYKDEKYQELLADCQAELRRIYIANASGTPTRVRPQIKTRWDMYIIHADLLILLTAAVMVVECKNGHTLKRDTIGEFTEAISTLFPNILRLLGLTSQSAIRAELQKVMTALDEGDFDAYLHREADDGQVAARYLTDTLASLKQKIIDTSARPSSYMNGQRRRNIALISLIKSYYQQKYAANGNTLHCECCGQPAFITYRNESYAEYHHLIPFGDYDGPDHYQNILALCPMCHRKLHYLHQDAKQPLYANVGRNSYSHSSVEQRLRTLHDEHRLKSYQLEFLLADGAIDEAAYNRILQATP